MGSIAAASPSVQAKGGLAHGGRPHQNPHHPDPWATIAYVTQNLRQWATSILDDPSLLGTDAGLPDPQLLVDSEQANSGGIIAALWSAVLSDDIVADAIDGLLESCQMGRPRPGKPSVRGSFPSFYKDQIQPHSVAEGWQPQVANEVIHAIEHAIIALYLIGESSQELGEKKDLAWHRIQYAVNQYLVPKKYAKVLAKRQKDPAVKDASTAYHERTLLAISKAAAECDLEQLRMHLLGISQTVGPDMGLCTQTMGASILPELSAETEEGFYASLQHDPNAPVQIKQRFDILVRTVMEVANGYDMDLLESIMQSYSSNIPGASSNPWSLQTLHWCIEMGHVDLIQRTLRHQRLNFAASLPFMETDSFMVRTPLELMRSNQKMIERVWISRSTDSFDETAAIVRSTAVYERGADPEDIPAPRDQLLSAASVLSRVEAGPWHDGATSLELMRHESRDYSRAETVEREPAMSAEAILARASHLLLQEDQKIVEAAFTEEETEPEKLAAFAVVRADYWAVNDLVKMADPQATVPVWVSAPNAYAAVLVPVQGTKAGILCVFPEAEEDRPVEDKVKSHIPWAMERTEDLLVTRPILLRPYQEMRDQFNRSLITLDILRAPALDVCTHPAESVRPRFLDLSCDGKVTTHIATAVALDCDCCGRTRLSVTPVHELEDMWLVHERLLDMPDQEHLESVNRERQRLGLEPLTSIDQIPSARPGAGIRHYMTVVNHERLVQGLDPFTSIEQMMSQAKQLSCVKDLVSQLRPSMPWLSPPAPETKLEEDHDHTWESFTL